MSTSLLILAFTLVCGILVLRVVSRKTPPTSVKKQSADLWNRLGSTPPPAGRGEAQAEPAIAVPDGFDAKDFLDGARLAYSRLLTAWAARDVEDMASLVTPGMLEKIKERISNDGQTHPVEVMVVHATLVEVTRSENEERVTVRFEALLHEENRPVDTCEIWQFVRSLHPEGMWLLDARDTGGGSPAQKGTLPT